MEFEKLLLLGIVAFVVAKVIITFFRVRSKKKKRDRLEVISSVLLALLNCYSNSKGPRARKEYDYLMLAQFMFLHDWVKEAGRYGTGTFLVFQNREAIQTDIFELGDFLKKNIQECIEQIEDQSEKLRVLNSIYIEPNGALKITPYLKDYLDNNNTLNGEEIYKQIYDKPIFIGIKYFFAR